MIKIKDLIELLEEMGNRKKSLGNVEFIFCDTSIKIKDGNYIRGEYFNDSKTIIFYPLLIKDKNDLKEVLLHEIGHHSGLSEDAIRH